MGLFSKPWNPFAEREEEECDHEWVENGESFASSGPYYSWEENCQFCWYDVWQNYSCRDCGRRKTGEKIERKTLIWYPDEVFSGEDAIDKRESLMK